jgi:hypothetical protein
MVSITRCQALCAGLIALPIVISSAASAQQLSSESVRPTTQAVALTAVPTIDGEVLGDAAWAGITPTSGFTQVRPNEGQAATQNTEVFVGFSDDTLYIGVMAYDENPEAILVTDSRRDSPLDDTDSFQVIIDGLLDRQNGYVFGTNPSGMEFRCPGYQRGRQRWLRRPRWRHWRVQH